MSIEEQQPVTIQNWIDTEPEEFDLRAEYEAEIEPLIKAVSEKMRALRMPYVIAVTPAQLDGGKAVACCVNANMGTVGRCAMPMLAGIYLLSGDVDTSDAIIEAAALKLKAASKPKAVH